MEKKSVWVVTRVDIGLVSLSVKTYALRWFDSINEAKSYLEIEYEWLCGQGCEPSQFTHSDMGCTYKDEYIMSQVMISLALGI